MSCARFPKDVGMALDNYILYPTKTHIHRFCVIILHLFVDYAVSSGVVIMNGCGKLGENHFFKGKSD